MKWTDVYIQNFLSITEAHLQLDGKGLVLIEGKNLSSNKFKSNGAGKSSALDSIVYAIYDTTSKGLSADDVVNNKVGKNTAVILEGYKGEDHYKIERYRKHTKNKNKVKLFCNGKEITGKSAKETNKMIEQIVGTDYNTFINSIMFSQGNGAGRFALATDKEKKEILEGLVNMGIYATSQDIAKDRVKAKDAEILEKKREGERLNWELAQVDQLEQQDQQNYENTKNIISQEQQRIGTVIAEMDKYARHNFPQAEALREEIEELKRKSETMIGLDISEYLNNANTAGQAVNDYNFKERQLFDKKDELVKKYKQVESSTNCPICGNLLDPVHRQEEMNNVREQLKGVLIQQQQEFAPEIRNKLEEAHQKAYAEYQEKKAIADNATNAYREVISDIQFKQVQVQKYESTLQGYKDEVERIKRTLETLGELPQPQPRTKERDNIRGKQKAQKEALLQLEREKQNLEDVVKVYSNAGVKSHILDLVTPFLNEQANKYLAILSGPDMEVKFSTQTKNKDGSVSDKFDLQLINRAGGDQYKANSEGEKKRADLSIALALQDFVASRVETNFALYDEVFDALDEVGSENVVTLLKERLKTVGTIYVITHSEHLKPLFEKSITVVKDKNGESTIIEGDGTT